MELVGTKPGSDIKTLKKYSNINKTQFILCDINYITYGNTGFFIEMDLPQFLKWNDLS